MSLDHIDTMNLYDLYKKYKNSYVKLKRISSHDPGVISVSNFESRLTMLDALHNSNIFNEKDCNILFDNKKEGIIDSKSYKYITKCGQGTICFMFFDTYGVALKFSDIPAFSMDKTNLYNPMNKKWRELYVLKECTKLVKSSVTQNLPILYKHQMCKKNDDNTLMLYSELAAGDLLAWLTEEHSSNDWKDMLFQVWHSLYVLQTKLKLVHNDLRLANILFFNDRVPTTSKYVMASDSYYLEKPNYIFVIWDFGSCELLNVSGKYRDSVRNKLESNKDLHFLHDLYKRLRVLALTHRYTIGELEDVLNKVAKDAEYVRQTKQENQRKFTKERFDEKYQISLAYYIMETNRFNELYEARKDIMLKGFTKIYLPPKDIDNMLKELSEKYNYSYKEALLPNGPNSRKIPSPKKLIDIFLPKYKDARDYMTTFLS